MNVATRSRLGLGAVLVLGLTAGCGSAGAGQSPSETAMAVTAPTPPPTADTTFVGDLDIGGRTMHIVCLGPTGTGRPTVVFEHGLGGDFGVWSEVITQVSASDRACSYDRAGAGMSEPATSPRTTADQVADLRALLDAAGMAPPYVLVGHSSGAWNALVHADAHRGDVAGVVLVDPRPPAASQQLLAALPPESPSEDDVIHQYRAGYRDWETDPTGNPENVHLANSALEADAADLGDIPLLVLVATDDEGEGADLAPELAQVFESIWADLEAELAARSTNGRLVSVTDSTHDMPFDRPDAIVEAIQSLLGRR